MQGVTGAKVMPLREGKDTHMGFVDFETDAQVQEAISQLDGTELDGEQLSVRQGMWKELG